MAERRVCSVLFCDVVGFTPLSEARGPEAVRAALDLVGAVAGLGAEAGVPGLGARAGVVTGEVAVTLSATQEGMVAGDAVNTAARVLAGVGGAQRLHGLEAPLTGRDAELRTVKELFRSEEPASARDG